MVQHCDSGYFCVAIVSIDAALDSAARAGLIDFMVATGAPPRARSKPAPCLPYKSLDLFPSPAPPPSHSGNHHVRSPSRKTLANVGFDHAMGGSALFRLSSAGQSLRLQQAMPNEAAAVSGVSSASNFLGSLRATTLLDYGFMREFSLLKRKPMHERNLSRLSTASVYSMRTTQLALEQQGQSELHPAYDWKKPPPLLQGDKSPSKGPDDIRAPVPVASSRFPPLTQRSVAEVTVAVPASNSVSATAISIDKALLTRSKHPTAPPQSHQPTKPPNLRRPNQHEAQATTPPVLMWHDLSEFDLRKCHPASVIAEIHGHLQEQDVAALCASTGYNRIELFGLWARFKALCSIAVSPNGIDKDTFRRGLPQLALEDQFFIDRVFDILDADGSGILEWSEFIEALSALEKGDAETRVRFLFRVYDLSGDGAIHRNEIQRFFLSSLLIPPSEDVVAVATHVVDKIFAAVGRESSDTVRVQDALTYIREHPGAADIYSLLGRTMVTNQRLVVDKSAPKGAT